MARQNHTIARRQMLAASAAITCRRAFGLPFSLAINTRPCVPLLAVAHAPPPCGVHSLHASSSTTTVFPGRLSPVARDAQRLPVRQVVPRATLAYGHDVVSLGLLGATAHPAAISARPCVSRQHSEPPCFVGLGAISTGCRVWPGGIVSLSAGHQTQRPVDGDAGWHARTS